MLLIREGAAVATSAARPHVPPADLLLVSGSVISFKMTTPGPLAIAIILFVVLFTNVADAILSLIPLGLLIAAITYIARHA